MKLSRPLRATLVLLAIAGAAGLLGHDQRARRCSDCTCASQTG
jgi:hypothetical protein